MATARTNNDDDAAVEKGLDGFIDAINPAHRKARQIVGQAKNNGPTPAELKEQKKQMWSWVNTPAKETDTRKETNEERMARIKAEARAFALGTAENQIKQKMATTLELQSQVQEIKKKLQPDSSMGEKDDDSDSKNESVHDVLERKRHSNGTWLYRLQWQDNTKSWECERNLDDNVLPYIATAKFDQSGRKGKFCFVFVFDDDYDCT